MLIAHFFLILSVLSAIFLVWEVIAAWLNRRHRRKVDAALHRIRNQL